MTAIAAYSTYYFPSTALQLTSCVLWLQGQAEHMSTSALRDLDVRARTYIARYRQVNILTRSWILQTLERPQLDPAAPLLNSAVVTEALLNSVIDD